MNRLDPSRIRTAALSLLLAGNAAWAQAQSTAVADQTVESLLFDRSVYTTDFTKFMTAPADWTGREWTRLGGLIAATRIAYQYDYDVREHFVPEPRPTDYHDAEDAVPVALMFGAMWLSGRRGRNPERFGEAQSMVRAGVLSMASTLVFKLGFGRARPDDGIERDQWWDAGRSMPSGHTALAFAVGTVFAESGTPKRRWVRRSLGYGLGISMMYLRVKHDSHWFSDTVPGAALGIASGRFVLRTEPSSRQADVFVTPLDGGAMLAFSLALD